MTTSIYLLIAMANFQSINYSVVQSGSEREKERKRESENRMSEYVYTKLSDIKIEDGDGLMN
jgi:hypothetical protein